MSDETVTQGSNGGGLDPERTQRMAGPGPNAYVAQDLSGSSIGGYKLVRKIAAGGMGVVYEAIQTKLDRKVALKVLTEQLDWRKEFLQRFEREAKAAAALSHPNMVQVYDYGEVDRRHYLIMEYIEGENLASYVDNHGKLSIEDAINVVEQAAQALKSAAEKSIIHRDIKPSNLLLTMDGRVKVADLGLAKILTEDSELTLSSVSIGSPHFIAPEQADDSKNADHRADIYSLGVTLLFLLTGRHAYDGASPISIVLAHTNKPLPSGAELGTPLPGEVEGLIQRMAAKRPDDRYQDYPSLLDDLNRVRSGFAPAAPIRKGSSGNSKLILAGAVLAGVAAVAGVTYFLATSKQKHAKKAASQTSAPQIVASQETGPIREGEFQPRSGPLNQQRGGIRREGPPNERASFDPEGPGGRGGAGMRLPTGPPSERQFITIPAGSPEFMLAKADAYADEHPDRFEEILDCYRQVDEAATGTPIGPQVGRKIQEYERKRKAALKEAMETREKKMMTLLAENKMQEAFDIWRDFPAGLRRWETDEQIRKLIEKNFPPGWHPEGLGSDNP